MDHSFLPKQVALNLHDRRVMASTMPFALRIQTDPALHIRTATEVIEISQLHAVLDAEHYLKDCDT